MFCKLLREPHGIFEHGQMPQIHELNEPCRRGCFLFSRMVESDRSFRRYGVILHADAAENRRGDLDNVFCIGSQNFTINGKVSYCIGCFLVGSGEVLHNNIAVFLSYFSGCSALDKQ